MERTATRAVFLDMTAFDARYLRRRFPKIYATCLQFGLDLAREAVPVSPAAHYVMGGVRTDLDGRTSVRGLYAAGEVACTGVHGANRLASNSLLEGLVFGARAGRAAAEDLKGAGVAPGESARREARAGERESSPEELGRMGAAALAVRKRVRRLMWERVGILRSRASLQRALSEFEQIARAHLAARPAQLPDGRHARRALRPLARRVARRAPPRGLPRARRRALARPLRSSRGTRASRERDDRVFADGEV